MISNYELEQHLLAGLIKYPETYTDIAPFVSERDFHSEDTIVNKIENTVAEGYLVTKSEIYMTRDKSYRAYVLIEVKKSVFDI